MTADNVEEVKKKIAKIKEEQLGLPWLCPIDCVNSHKL